MEITDLPHSFICRERRSLEEFFENNDLNETLVDNMSNIYYLQVNFRERALMCMNMAYYICTLILSEKHPDWSFDKYCQLAYCGNKAAKIHQAVTLSLVSIYLKGLDDKQQDNLRKLKSRLESFLANPANIIETNELLNKYNYLDALNQLKKGLSYYSINANEFAFRIIDKETVDDVMKDTPINWAYHFDYFKDYRLREFVKNYGVTEEEKHYVVELLRKITQNFYSPGVNDKLEQLKTVLDAIEKEFCPNYLLTINTASSQSEGADEEGAKDIAWYKARIEELEEEVDRYQNMKSGTALGINQAQSSLFVLSLANTFGFNYTNKKNDLSPIAHKLFGWGKKRLINCMSEPCAKEERDELADIFKDVCPKLHDTIMNWGEDTPEDTPQ